MEFTNLTIHPDQIPQAGAVTLQPIQFIYLKVLRMGWAIIFSGLLLVLAALFYFIDELHDPLPMGLAAVAYLLFVCGTLVIGTGSFKRKAYAIRQKDLLYQTGWLFQKTHMIPYDRIQHCIVNSGPLERRFGLATLSVFTAAGDDKDITLHGLNKADADAMKEWILQQIQPLLNEREMD